MYYNILQTKEHNIHYLNRYIKFIEYYNLKNKDLLDNEYYEIHHICPKADSLFPEYKKFKDFPWNAAKLTLRQHFIAHWLLTKSYPDDISMARAICLMADMRVTIDPKLSNKYRNSKIYAIAKLAIIESQQGMVAAINLNTNEYCQVTQEEFETGNYKGVVAGMVSAVIIGTTNKVWITQEDYKNNPNKYEHITTGTVTCLDNDGNFQRISKEEWDNGNFLTATTGMVTCIVNGNSTSISKEEFKQGGFGTPTTGSVYCKDITTGENVRVSQKEYDSNPGKYLHNHKGFVNAIDLDGNKVRMTKEEYYLPENKGLYSTLNAKTKIYIDEDGNRSWIPDLDKKNKPKKIEDIKAVDFSGNIVYITIEQLQSGLYKEFRSKATVHYNEEGIPYWKTKTVAFDNPDNKRVRSIYKVGNYIIEHINLIKPHEVTIGRKPVFVHNPITNEEKILTKNEFVTEEWKLGKLPLVSIEDLF